MCLERDNHSASTFQISGKCAGRNCRNEGKHFLRIIYLNKVGCFCDNCKDQLLKNGLIVDNEMADDY